MRTNDTTDIILQKKNTPSGKPYFQGIGDHENVLLFRMTGRRREGRELWKLEIKSRSM